MSLTVAVLVLAAAAVAAAVGRVMQSRRSHDLADWATAHGWHYAEHDSRFAHLPMGYPYNTGHNHSTHDVVTGVWKGHPAVCFTYHFDMNRTKQAGQGLHPRFFSVWLLELPTPLPAMQVRRESQISTIVLPPGMARVDVGHTPFAQTFKVFSNDNAFAGRVLTPQTTQFLLDNGGGGFDICDGHILVVRDGVLTAANVDLHLDYLTALIELLSAA